uniref:Zinc finger, CCHC-type n=1 Tax=Tanacetum cinerariifolium TaxID=118510 RepID=A0A6L2LSS9_TANCI|nr:zinc finger, CCHC-type [Tanacetum cinerariifolium]
MYILVILSPDLWVKVDQKRLEDKQPKEKTNVDCLVKEHEKEYQTRWKIKMKNVLNSCNQRSTQQCIKSGVTKQLGIARIQQQNGLVDETNVTLFVKVRCFLIRSGLSKVFWVEDTTSSTYLVNKSPSLAIGFTKPIYMLGFICWLASIKQGMLEPVKVKCIFFGYHKSIVGNKLWRLNDVNSKVVLYRNMGFNESREYKKTFIGSGVVAAVEKIYAHESLTFNNTVACEVISKWKAGLKDDMNARSDVYVLSNGYRKSSDDNHDYYWKYAPAKENILGLEIIRDQRGNTLRVSQSRFYNEKLPLDVWSIAADYLVSNRYPGVRWVCNIGLWPNVRTVYGSGWMSFSKRPGKNTPQCYSKPLDSLKNWNNRFFWVDECVFPPAVEWRTNASKDRMPASGTYSMEAVRVLDTHRTPIQKQPEALLCLVGISRRYYLGDDVYPTFHYDDDREMDLFSLIRVPNPTKVKTGSRPRAPHELPLLTLTAFRVIDMDAPATMMDSSGVPSAIEKSPLDFADEAEASGQETAAPEVAPVGEKVLLLCNSVWLLTFLCMKDPGSENVSSPTEVGSPRSVYRPEWGVTNGSLLDTPEACQDLVDHVAPPGYFSELHHMHNDDFLGQYNINLARIQARESEIKNLEALLETEANMKRAAKEKSDGLSQELERMQMRQAFTDVVYAGIAKGMSEGLKHGVEHGHAQRTIESLDAYDPEAEAKFAVALQSLKYLKFPLLDQLEGLKDDPMDVIMASLYLEDDTGNDALQFIRDLRPSSSQLAIPVYLEVRDPQNPWACTEEIKLADAIAANISRAEQKKRSRIVCRTHGVGSAHHARSDRVPVSAPIVVP